jgi:enoyl-CoA hydratase/carnithine racemase
MSSLDFTTISLDIEDGIATLWLDRPEKMNAFTPQMKDEMIAAFDHTDANDDVRAVIVTGRGRAFCAGADLSSGGDTFDYDKRKGVDGRRDGGGQVTLRIFRSLKPVIGAINGAAVGIGATMQLPMDIRIAADNAKFGFVFARRGITLEAASSWFLTRTVGLSTALEWCYSGRVFPATEAHERGLVRSLHAPDDLYSTAVALAHELTDESAPVSIAMTRQMLWSMHAEGHPMDAHRIDSQAIRARGRSDDAKEGVSSFLEKRPAKFPNRVSTDMPDFFDWQHEPPFE